MILVMSIVPHSSGELITSAATRAGAAGGTIMMGTGTASNSVLQLLGLGDSSKDITLNVVENDILEKVQTEILNAASDKKEHFGVLFNIDVGNFIKSGNVDFCKKDNNHKRGDNEMKDSYELINVIVNKGYAEDAMAAARKAGAGGGTIIQARGTAKEGDAKFFGMEIVPEKDMLLILVPSEKKEDIVKAITELSCLQKAGSGIIYCNHVNDFTVLGKTK